MSLDFRFPLGRPSSPVCRWCRRPRVERRRHMSAPRYLICLTCDIPENVTSTTTTTTSSSTEETA